MNYDIAIIGAGIVGSSIAYHLSKYKQLKIVVLEQSSSINPEKSSIGHSRITGRATGSECQAYIDMLPISNEIYKNLNKDDPGIFYPGDCITFSRNHSEKLENIIHQIKENHISADIIKNVQNTQKIDQFLRRLKDNENAIIEKHTPENMLGILDPTRTTLAFQNIAKQNGTTFCQNHKLLRLTENKLNTRLEIESNQTKTSITANKVILATNANTEYPSKLNNIISRQRIPLIFIPIQDLNFENSYLELTQAGKYELFVMPERISDKLYLKAGIHHIAPYEDTSLNDEEFMTKMKPIILQKVKNHFPFIKDSSISNAVMCEYAITPDGLPLVGQLNKNIWVAAGFNGNGCKHAAAFGKLLADSITSDTRHTLLKCFDPLRFF